MVATDHGTTVEHVAGRADPAAKDEPQFTVPQSAMLLVIVSAAFWCTIAIAIRFLFF